MEQKFWKSLHFWKFRYRIYISYMPFWKYWVRISKKSGVSAIYLPHDFFLKNRAADKWKFPKRVSPAGIGRVGMSTSVLNFLWINLTVSRLWGLLFLKRPSVFFPFTEVFYNYLYLKPCYEVYLSEAFKSIYFWKCLPNFLETSY